MDKEISPSQNRLVIRNYSLENVPHDAPVGLFINPSEIFVMRLRNDGAKEISLWLFFDAAPGAAGTLDRPHVKVSSLTLRLGEYMTPRNVIDALRAGAYPAESLRREASRHLPDVKHRTVVCRFLSTDELAELLQVFISCELAYSKIVATEATAVAVNSNEEVVNVADLLAVADEKPEVADFDVKPPVNASVNRETAEQEHSRRPTLQEIEDREQPEYVTQPYQRKRNRGRNYWILALLVVIALTIGWAVVSFLPTILPDSAYAEGEEMVVDDNYSYPAPVDLDVPVLPTDTIDSTAVDQNDPAPVREVVEPSVEQAAETGQEALELADIEYLNTNQVWDRSQLKSDKYLAFFDLFSKGNILEIAEADYFAVPGTMKNPMAQKFIDMLWASYKTGTQSANEKQLRNLKGQQKIDLPKLYDTIARYRDKTPNKSPRPKR